MGDQSRYFEFPKLSWDDAQFDQEQINHKLKKIECKLGGGVYSMRMQF